MQKPTGCPLCDRQGVGRQRLSADAIFIDCPACGRFIISGTLEVLLPMGDLRERRYILSGLTRQRKDRGTQLVIGSDEVEKLLAEATVPRSPLDVIDRVLLDIIEAMPSFHGGIGMPSTNYTRYFLRGAKEYQGVLEILHEEGMIDLVVGADPFMVTPKPAGWRRAQELRQHSVRSDQVFVAMRFSDALALAYDEGIAPALRQAGYTPLRIDRVPHNGTIDDRIIAEIRRSAFVVADLTEHAAGVYFEAGFALGHGLEVIWCCRQDHLDDAHFDVKQYNMIVWTSPDALREKLYERVRATMPVRDTIADTQPTVGAS